MRMIKPSRRHVQKMQRISRSGEGKQQSVQMESVVAQGDKLVVIAQEAGIYRLTGLPYDTRWVHEFRFRDGRIASCREIFDGAGVLMALQPASIPPGGRQGPQFV